MFNYLKTITNNAHSLQYIDNSFVCDRVNKSPFCVLELMKTKEKNTLHPTPPPIQSITKE